MAPVLEGKPICLDPKNSAKRRAPNLENQRIRLGTKVKSKLVPRKLDLDP
jgi:hypothetical protein